MIRERLRLSVFLGALCGFAAPEASAETIDGKVRDSSGAPVARAEIALATPELTVIAASASDDRGNFTISVPGAGHYLLIVRAPAFRETRLAVTATSGAPTSVDVVLQLAPLAKRSPSPRTGRASTSCTSHRSRSASSGPRTSSIGSGPSSPRPSKVRRRALQRTSPTMAGVFVRGLTGNKVNVFVDGVRYSNGAQRGGVNTFLDLIEPEALESIEVVRGPSSAQYGSDALGGSVQFFSKPPAHRGRGRAALAADAVGRCRLRPSRTAAARACVGYMGPTLGVTGTLGGRRAGATRPGEGIDSHAAVTRFLGVPSDVLMDDRLPDTGFHQDGGVVRANWILDPSTSLVASYMRTVQDDGERYDQLLGGDGNLISELNDLSLDLFSVRFERLGAWPVRSHASFTYSFNSQREERVNQGGNGNPTADHRPRAGAHDGARRAGVDDATVRGADDADVRRRPQFRGADLGLVQRQSRHRRRDAAASARSRRCVVHAGRRLRAGGVRRRSPIACG